MKEIVIRKMIDHWIFLNNKKLGTFELLGAMMDIDEIEENFNYILNIKLLTLSRNLIEKETPGKKYFNEIDSNENLSSLFSYDYDLPEKISKDGFHKEDIILTSTVKTYECSETQACSKCGGSGKCHYCHGRGKIECSHCDGYGVCSKCKGRGKIVCDSCKGTGTSSFSSEMKCVSCEGTGYKNCTKCKETGMCEYCKGAGFEECSICEGKKICWKCDGKGRETCERCDGSGYFQRYNCIRTNLKNKSESFIFTFSSLIEDFFHKNNIEGKTIFNDVLFELKNEDIYLKNNINEAKKLIKNSKIKEFIDEEKIISLFKLSENEKIGRVHLTIEKFKSYKIRYHFKEKEYEIYIILDKDRRPYYIFHEIPKMNLFEKIKKHINYAIPYINTCYKFHINKKLQYLIDSAIIQRSINNNNTQRTNEILIELVKKSPTSPKLKEKLISKINSINSEEEIEKINLTKLSNKAKKEIILFVNCLTFIQNKFKFLKNNEEITEYFKRKTQIKSNIKITKLKNKIKIIARLLNDPEYRFKDFYIKPDLSIKIGVQSAIFLILALLIFFIFF